MTNEEASFILANIDRRVCDDELNDALEMAIKALEQTRWIPCTERLPEQSGWYLVSLKNMNVQKAWYRAAPINQGGSYWRGSIKRPIAWMPLPEPMKVGEENADSN